jgi:hypothetical protein
VVIVLLMIALVEVWGVSRNFYTYKISLKYWDFWTGEFQVKTGIQVASDKKYLTKIEVEAV